jgi:hypothetical protein
MITETVCRGVYSVHAWRLAAVSAAVVVLAAVSGCQADEPGDRTGAAGTASTAGSSSAPATCAPKFGVNDPSADGQAVEGMVSEGLPDEIRCLPSVAFGELVAATGDTALPRRSLTVGVADGTTREQTLALCKRITGLGYGPGGTHKIDMLTVGGGLTAGTYLSTAQKECVQAG